MRSYLIEDFHHGDLDRLSKNLDSKNWTGSLAGLYWLPVPEELLSDEQKAHRAECGPYAMGLEVEDTWIKLELLVRAQSRMRCSCVCFAAPAQREYMIDTLDQLLRDLDIQVW